MLLSIREVLLLTFMCFYMYKIILLHTFRCFSFLFFRNRQEDERKKGKEEVNDNVCSDNVYKKGD